MNPILITMTHCRPATQSPGRVFMMAAAASVILLAGFTGSCATTRGFGQDVEKTGDKIQEAASQ